MLIQCKQCNTQTNNAAFCSPSCSLAYHSMQRHLESLSKLHPCIVCNTNTLNKKYCSRKCHVSHSNRLKPKQTKKPHYCIQCTRYIGDGSKFTNKKCQECKRNICKDLNNLSLSELKIKYPSLTNYHSAIRGHARRVYNGPTACFNCGYNKYVEVCHIHPLSSFDKDCLLSTINHKDNLVALCRNCHWEFDSGLISIT